MSASRTMGVLALTVTLTGCGGGSTSPTAPQAFQQTLTGNAGAFATTQHTLTAPRSGQMRLVLSWANNTIDLDLYLTDATCNQYPPLRCTLLATSETLIGTSETINRMVAAGDQLKVWVDNFHQTLPSDYTIQVTIQ